MSGRELLRKAESGDADAMYALSVAHLKGNDVEQDFGKASQLHLM